MELPPASDTPKYYLIHGDKHSYCLQIKGKKSINAQAHLIRATSIKSTNSMWDILGKSITSPFATLKDEIETNRRRNKSPTATLIFQENGRLNSQDYLENGKKSVSAVCDARISAHRRSNTSLRSVHFSTISDTLEIYKL